MDTIIPGDWNVSVKVAELHPSVGFQRHVVVDTASVATDKSAQT